MDYEFGDNYVLLVLLLLWGLCFCRNLLQSVTACAQLLESCVARDLCGMAACCPGGLAELARQGVVLYCFLQPALFCVLYMLHRSGGGDRRSSTILHNAQLNTSSLCYFHVNSSVCTPGPASVAAVHAVQIDFLFPVLPFSLLVSATSMLWVNCVAAGALKADTPWDADLEDAVFVYETVYYAELWCMNLAVVAVACSERSLLEVHYAALALTLMLVHVCAQSRAAAEYSAAEHVGATLVTLVFAAVLAPLWAMMVQVSTPSLRHLACSVARVRFDAESAANMCSRRAGRLSRGPRARRRARGRRAHALPLPYAGARRSLCRTGLARARRMHRRDEHGAARRVRRRAQRTMRAATHLIKHWRHRPRQNAACMCVCVHGIFALLARELAHSALGGQPSITLKDDVCWSTVYTLPLGYDVCWSTMDTLPRWMNTHRYHAQRRRL